MELGHIRDIIEAEAVVGEDRMDRDVKVVFACDLMSDVLAFAPPGSLLLTGLTNIQVVRTAEMAELAGVCFVRDKQPEKETTRLAEGKGLPVLRTRFSMFETCGLLCARGLVGVDCTGHRAGDVEADVVVNDRTEPGAGGDE